MDVAIIEWLDMARIDIKNQGEGNDVRVKVVKGENCHIFQPQWFAKEGIGYVLETTDKHHVLELECEGEGQLMLRLMGVDRKSLDGNRLPLWVDYTRLSIDDEVIFWELKPQWHNKNYIYKRHVDDGEILRVEISWAQHGYRGGELVNLLSMLCGVLVNKQTL